MCNAGRFYNELPKMPDITFILYDSIDLIVEASRLKKSVTNYEATRVIDQIHSRKAWGYQKWIKEDHAEVGLYMAHDSVYGDAIIRHELNHVDFDSIKKYINKGVISEDFCMLQDMRENEALDIWDNIYRYQWDKRTRRGMFDSEFRMYWVEPF